MDSKKIERIAHDIARMAQQAVLYEVTATPKPGLVDRDNNGSHSDMDFYTFMASASALYSGFYESALMGLTHDSPELFNEVRKIGIDSERRMFESTDGVNTHKGIIFAMSILCAATGRYYKDTPYDPAYDKERDNQRQGVVTDISSIVAGMTAGLSERDFSILKQRPPQTMGERFYLTFGYKGARGEAESGFKTAIDYGLPVIRKYAHKHKNMMSGPLNSMLIDTFMTLLTVNTDTNLLSRGGLDGLALAKKEAKAFMEEGGMAHPQSHSKLKCMNETFSAKRLSPGGTADLLAVSVYFAMLEGVI